MSKLGRLAVAAVVLGCAALPVSAIIRSPVDSKCRSFGLKGGCLPPYGAGRRREAAMSFREVDYEQ